MVKKFFGFPALIFGWVFTVLSGGFFTKHEPEGARCHPSGWITKQQKDKQRD